MDKKEISVEAEIRRTKQEITNIIEHSPLNAAILEIIIDNIKLQVKSIVDSTLFEQSIQSRNSQDDDDVIEISIGDDTEIKIEDIKEDDNETE